MTSRQRIFATLNRQIPDRVPISTYELVGFNSKAWENNEPSYARLMQMIREQTDCIAMWEPSSNETFLGSSIALDLKVKEHREDNVTITKKILHTPKGDLTQTSKVEDNVHTTWQIEHWCKSMADVEKALSVPFAPVDYDFSDLQRIQNEVGENGIIMSSLADPLWMAADLMEFGDYTVWAMTETEHFAKTVAIIHERCMENLRRMLDLHIVDLYRICGPEYATPPYLPPELFKRFVVPYVTEMVDLIHCHGAKVRFHCHGKIKHVLDMIVETGSDAIDPCEAPPDGDIALAELKQRIGNNMCIFGNLQLKLLEHGSPNDVEKAVKDCIKAARDGGGYVIMPTAAPINVPLAKKTEENYLQFIDVALREGKYE